MVLRIVSLTNKAVLEGFPLRRFFLLHLFAQKYMPPGLKVTPVWLTLEGQNSTINIAMYTLYVAEKSFLEPNVYVLFWAKMIDFTLR